LRALSRFEVCNTKQSLGKRYGLGKTGGPDNQQGLTEEQRASYQGAFEAVLAVPIAAGIGYWCDGRFDSAPVGLLVGTAIGFLAMLLRLVRMRPAEDIAVEAIDKAKAGKPATPKGPKAPEEPAVSTESATETSSTADRPESDQESDR
jgi:F0F1-type ATP synthase assembly protein I